MKDYIKSDVTKVSDINGDLKLEDNTQKLLAEEEKLLVSKERKNDYVYISNFLFLKILSFLKLRNFIWKIQFNLSRQIIKSKLKMEERIQKLFLLAGD